MKKNIFIVLFLMFVTTSLFANTIDLTYNGKYETKNNKADEKITLKLAIYDKESKGNKIWESAKIKDVIVSSGTFSVKFSPELKNSNLESLYLQVTINKKELATREKLTDIVADNYGFPIGSIIMWSGTADNIPQGWVLCDGTNGTPNLKNNFIIGIEMNRTIDMDNKTIETEKGAETKEYYSFCYIMKQK